MDVNNTVDRRDLELANRLLREREHQHAHELENLQTGHRDQIESLRQKQQETIEGVRNAANETVASQRDHFDNEIQKASDSYKKTIEEERGDSYDKFGRLNADTNRQLSRERENSARQIQQLVEVNGHELKNQLDQHRSSVDKLQEKFVADTQNLQKHYEKDVSTHNEGNQELIAKQARSFREDADAKTRKNSEELIRTKAANQDLLKKRYEDSEIERERLVDTAKLRVQQVDSDKVLLQKELSKKNEKSMDDFREHASEAIATTFRDSNTAASQAKAAEIKRFSKLNQEFSSKLQNKDNIARETESDLMLKYTQERDRNEMHNQIAEARHRQDMFRTTEALSESNKLSSDEMKTQYADNLHGLDKKARERFNNFAADAQKRMYEQEFRSSGDRSAVLQDRDREIARLAIQKRSEKAGLVREYETRQSTADELRARQYNDAKAALDRDMKFVREKTDHEITAMNRENQVQLFEKGQALMNRTEELETERKMELDSKDQLHGDRIKRLTDTYNRTLMANKDAFDDESDTIRHENTMNIVKNRGDMEHEKRVQLTDLLNKSRAAMASMESRFNAQKDSFDDELAKARTEHDKTLREAMRKARETVESERTIHQRELEAKDMQSKEKMRLQEEAFRDSIEKLKRSHELSLKKS